MRIGFLVPFLLISSGCLTDQFPYELEELNLPDGGYKCVVVGDWGRRGNNNQLSNSYVMNVVACEHQINSIITVGDNFYDDGVTSTSDSHWNESFESVFDGDCLSPIPWWPSLGNHDIRGSAQAQYDYSDLSERWNFHAPYYDRWVMTEDSVNIHFVTVDTSPFVSSYYERPNNDAMAEHLANSNSSMQMIWLDSVLAVGNPDWLVVYGHHPVFGAEGHHGSTSELIQLFDPLFDQYDVDVYFSGHNHSLELSKVDHETLYATSGSFSRSQSTVELQPFNMFGTGISGFLVSSYTKDSLQLNFVSAKGEMLFKHVLGK